jgi:hypothetical protein
MTPAVRSLQESLFLGGAMFIVLLVIVGAFLGALVIRWIVKGPSPPPWGTRTDDERDGRV